MWSGSIGLVRESTLQNAQTIIIKG
jgi:hypothetical protein